MMMRKILWLLLVSIVIAPTSLSAAEPTGKDWYITPKVGYSGFTNVFGLEVQHKHLALDIGYPPSGGVRYYFRPHRHSWFAGLYGAGYGYDSDETKDGIPYTRFSKIEGGLGGGYRWFWRSRWNLELGATVSYGEHRWKNSYAERTAQVISLGPIATVGISF